MRLSELLNGRKVSDIEGYVSHIDGEPTFKLSRLILDDESTIAVEGEHDFPYLADYRGVLTLPQEQSA